MLIVSKAPKTWRRFRNPASEKCHLVAEIEDDNGEKLIAYKWWGKSKQRWQYEIEPRWIMNMFHWENAENE